MKTKKRTVVANPPGQTYQQACDRAWLKTQRRRELFVVIEFPQGQFEVVEFEYADQNNFYVAYEPFPLPKGCVK